MAELDTPLTLVLVAVLIAAALSMSNEPEVASVLTFFSGPVRKAGLSLGLFVTVVPACVFGLAVVLASGIVVAVSRLSGGATTTENRLRSLNALIFIAVSCRAPVYTIVSLTVICA
jgi:uncharacterized membrane protein YvlD (DUF360 family)